METLMRWVIVILCVVAALVVYYLLIYLFHALRHRGRIATFDNYDRTLSDKEVLFLEDAIGKLEYLQREAENYPKWYGWFLTLGFIPMGLLIGGIIYGLYELGSYAFASPSLENTGALITDKIEFGISYAIFFFVILIFTAWTLYTITLRSRPLSNYVALNSDIWGYGSDAVYARQVESLIHKVRARQVKLGKSFDAEAFLEGRNKSHQKGCLKWMIGLLGIGSILLYFDMNYSRTLYADRLESSGSYFSLGEKSVFTFSELEVAQLNCVFSDGRPQARYILMKNGNQLAEFYINLSNLYGLSILDDALRENRAVFKPHTRSRNGEIVRYFYEKRYVELLASKLAPHGTRVKYILHFDDLAK